MRYKVGDRVKIVKKRVFGMNSIGRMDGYLDTIMTIASFSISGNDYRMKEDKGIWNWNDSMINHDESPANLKNVGELVEGQFYNEVSSHSKETIFCIRRDGNLYKKHYDGDWEREKETLSTILSYEFTEITSKYPSLFSTFYYIGLDEQTALKTTFWSNSSEDKKLWETGNYFESREDGIVVKQKIEKLLKENTKNYHKRDCSAPMKYEVGEKVQIVDERVASMNFDGGMDKYLGTVMTIALLAPNVFGYSYKMEEDNGLWYWNDSMINEEKTKLLKPIDPLRAPFFWEDCEVEDKTPSYLNIDELVTGKHYTEIVRHSDKYLFAIKKDGNLYRKVAGGTWFRVNKPIKTILNYKFEEFKSNSIPLFTTFFHIKIDDKISVEKDFWIGTDKHSALMENGNVFTSLREVQGIEQKIKSIFKENFIDIS